MVCEKLHLHHLHLDCHHAIFSSSSQSSKKLQMHNTWEAKFIFIFFFVIIIFICHWTSCDKMKLLQKQMKWGLCMYEWQVNFIFIICIFIVVINISIVITSIITIFLIICIQQQQAMLLQRPKKKTKAREWKEDFDAKDKTWGLSFEILLASEERKSEHCSSSTGSGNLRTDCHLSG